MPIPEKESGHFCKITPPQQKYYEFLSQDLVLNRSCVDQNDNHEDGDDDDIDTHEDVHPLELSGHSSTLLTLVTKSVSLLCPHGLKVCEIFL